MSLTKAAVDILGAKLADNNVEGPVTPTGMTKGPRGTVICNPSMMNPRATKTGPLVDPGVPTLQSQQQPQAVQPTVQPKKGSRKRAKAEAPRQTLVKSTVHVNGMDISTQYVHLNIGAGILVLWLNELSFVPPQAMRDAQGNITGKVRFNGIEGDWANLGQTFTDRDGTRCVVLFKM